MDVEDKNPTPPAPSDPQVTPDGGDPEPKAPAEAPGKVEEPVPTGEEPETPSPALPDHGVDPDNPPDPDAGDLPTDPNKTTGDELDNQPPDLKSMSRAERATYFKDLAATAEQEAEKRVAEAYQPEPLDDLKQKYLDAGHSEFEANMLARDEMRDQEKDILSASNQRAKLNATLAIEAMEVMNTTDWLNPSNKDSYDQKSSNAAIELYDRMCLTRDENTADVDAQGNPVEGTGQIIGASMTPKEFYGLLDTIRSSGVETAKLAGQKAAEEQMAAVAAPSSNSNKREASFEELSNAEKRAELQKQGILVT